MGVNDHHRAEPAEDDRQTAPPLYEWNEWWSIISCGDNDDVDD